MAEISAVQGSDGSRIGNGAEAVMGISSGGIQQRSRGWAMGGWRISSGGVEQRDSANNDRIGEASAAVRNFRVIVGLHAQLLYFAAVGWSAVNMQHLNAKYGAALKKSYQDLKMHHQLEHLSGLAHVNWNRSYFHFYGLSLLLMRI